MRTKPKPRPGFTAGKWKASWENPDQDNPDNPFVWPTIVSVMVDEQSKVRGVEVVGTEGFYGPTLEESKANALLCSAAPGLFYAAECEEVAEWDDWESMVQWCRSTYPDLYREANKYGGSIPDKVRWVAKQLRTAAMRIARGEDNEQEQTTEYADSAARRA